MNCHCTSEVAFKSWDCCETTVLYIGPKKANQSNFLCEFSFKIPSALLDFFLKYLVSNLPRWEKKNPAKINYTKKKRKKTLKCAAKATKCLGQSSPSHLLTCMQNTVGDLGGQYWLCAKKWLLFESTSLQTAARFPAGDSLWAVAKHTGIETDARGVAVARSRGHRGFNMGVGGGPPLLDCGVLARQV